MMDFTQTDKESVAHNILHLMQNVYQRDSELYKSAHKALSKLSMKALNDLFVLARAGSPFVQAKAGSPTQGG